MAMYDSTAQFLLAFMAIGLVSLGLIDNIAKFASDFIPLKVGQVVERISLTLQICAVTAMIFAAIASYFLVIHNYPFATHIPVLDHAETLIKNCANFLS
jgi:hypothetical protein